MGVTSVNNIPTGSEPDDTEQLYGAVPPEMFTTAPPAWNVLAPLS
jgi:hypothetical protein